jgi:outer membrane protein assembly factor BamE (lipoprotein component of BamABCDE complex)
MRRRTTTLRFFGIGLAALAALGAVQVGAYLVWRSWNEPFVSQVGQVRSGMTEGQVLDILGAPAEVHLASEAPDDYYVRGYDYKRKKITGKVLVYVGGSDAICYVWVDPHGRVEDVFLGGS